jgi:nucleoside-diphosphate-sugar epimerase
MTETPRTAPIVVTGASGKTGRRIAARLAAAGHPVRGVGRTTEPRDFAAVMSEAFTPAGAR